MHPTAMSNAKLFFDTYSESFKNITKPKIVEIGSQDVNGTLRDLVPSYFDYIGVDYVDGKNVDIVLSDPYEIPIESDSLDIVISSSVFEHSEMFWLLYLEIMRILKPRGIFYLNVPSNGMFHRFPVDCWRFYPDSGSALESWGMKNDIPNVLLESFISEQMNNAAKWNDFVAIFLKDKKYISNFSNRIIAKFKNFQNGKIFGSENYINFSELTEDHKRLQFIASIVNQQITIR